MRSRNEDISPINSRTLSIPSPTLSDKSISRGISTPRRNYSSPLFFNQQTYVTEMPWSLLCSMSKMIKTENIENELGCTWVSQMKACEAWFQQLEGETQYLHEELANLQINLCSTLKKKEELNQEIIFLVRKHQNELLDIKNEYNTLMKEHNKQTEQLYEYKQQVELQIRDNNIPTELQLQQDALCKELAQTKIERDKKIGELYMLEKKNCELQECIKKLEAKYENEHQKPKETLEMALKASESEKEKLQSDLIAVKLKRAEEAYGRLQAKEGKSKLSSISKNTGLAGAFKTYGDKSTSQDLPVTGKQGTERIFRKPSFLRRYSSTTTEDKKKNNGTRRMSFKNIFGTSSAEPSPREPRTKTDEDNLNEVIEVSKEESIEPISKDSKDEKKIQKSDLN